MKRNVLILCTGNSCRSQMAEAFLKSFDRELNVQSAGTNPSESVNNYTIKVMQEISIDISKNKPKNVDIFIKDSFDYVITVCDNAKETCPVFFGKVGNTMHIVFEDPAEAKGTDVEILQEHRRIRDLIRNDFYKFYNDYIAEI